MDYSMQSLGEYLKTQREAKGLTINEAAAETNIAKKYIEALETDEYGFFPAEMYVLGFLSSYIEVLELDKDYVLSMYYRAIDREKEVPLEAFYNIHKPDNFFKKNIKSLLLIVPIVLALSIVGVIFYNNSDPRNITPGNYDTKIPKELSIDINTLEANNKFDVGISDTVHLNENDSTKNSIIFLGHGSSDNQIKFRLGQNEYTYKAGAVLNVDLGSIGLDNLAVEILDITRNTVSISFIIQANANSKFDISPYKACISNEVPITDASQITSFNFTVTTEKPVWIAYQADKEQEIQQVLNAGASLKFKFIDGVRLLVGNAGVVTITSPQFTNVIRGGTTGESSQSIFYKKPNGEKIILYRAQLK